MRLRRQRYKKALTKRKGRIKKKGKRKGYQRIKKEKRNKVKG